jgi:hypothetical protein
MAYDKDLAERIRQAIGSPPGLTEKEMFGGIGFMVQGNMAVGIIGEELMVRIAKEDTDQALGEPGTRIFDFTGRPMKGWVMVGQQGFAAEQDFHGWIQRGVEFALTLPPK